MLSFVMLLVALPAPLAILGLLRLDASIISMLIAGLLRVLKLRIRKALDLRVKMRFGMVSMRTLIILSRAILIQAFLPKSLGVQSPGHLGGNASIIIPPSPSLLDVGEKSCSLSSIHLRLSV